MVPQLSGSQYDRAAIVLFKEVNNKKRRFIELEGGGESLARGLGKVAAREDS